MKPTARSRERLHYTRIRDGRALNMGRHRPVTWLNVTIRQGVPVAIDIARRNLRRPNLSRRRRAYWQHRLDRFAQHWSVRDIRDLVKVQPSGIWPVRVEDTSCGAEVGPEGVAMKLDEAVPR
jgi:hypothetical protein